MKITCVKPFSSSKRGKQLLKSGLFSDICIRIEGTSFRCHKIILACASEFFEKLFQNDGLTTGEVTLEETTPEIFQIFLDFIYDPVDNQALESLSPEVLMSLMKCANMWLAEDFVDKCASILISQREHMQPETLISLFAVSYEMDHKPLMVQTIEILKDSWRSAMDDRATVKMNIGCFVEYFENTYNVFRPRRRFKMIENWVKENNYVRNSPLDWKAITEIVKSIQFQELSVEEFYNGPGKSNILSDSEKFEILYRVARAGCHCMSTVKSDLMLADAEDK
ncbi:ectoderm-neural cortex protein 1-like [Drosophila eugracilis]|uniref:ectoderm-neural cortex protein 1-like n=1 Tax=Drosophila eugracilis TaxID=29029 RepID=UPI0007E88C31|nr:ectoderm-neural cortex protein 1-like [Drosophila eugracilis]